MVSNKQKSNPKILIIRLIYYAIQISVHYNQIYFVHHFQIRKNRPFQILGNSAETGWRAELWRAELWSRTKPELRQNLAELARMWRNVAELSQNLARTWQNLADLEVLLKLSSSFPQFQPKFS